MKDDNKAIGQTAHIPVIVHLGPPSIEELLRHVDPAPDDETERFINAIYADRRKRKAVGFVDRGAG
jgi:hypothetical protein